jgi:hypothetical protein
MRFHQGLWAGSGCVGGSADKGMLATRGWIGSGTSPMYGQGWHPQGPEHCAPEMGAPLWLVTAIVTGTADEFSWGDAAAPPDAKEPMSSPITIGSEKELVFISHLLRGGFQHSRNGWIGAVEFSRAGDLRLCSGRHLPSPRLAPKKTGANLAVC